MGVYTETYDQERFPIFEKVLSVGQDIYFEDTLSFMEKAHLCYFAFLRYPAPWLDYASIQKCMTK